MTSAELKSLALKLAAIYLVIQFLLVVSFSALGYAFALYQWFDSEVPSLAAALIGALAIILPLITARLLWVQSNRLLSSEAQGAPASPAETTQYRAIQTAILLGVGILIIGISVPDLISATVQLLYENTLRRSEAGGEITAATLFYFFGSLLQLLFALSLLLGRKGWTELLYRLRYGDTQK